MSKSNSLGKGESISCKVYTDGFVPQPGIYRKYDIDFERINYRLNMLGSNIQDISLQIKELKELIQKNENI